MLDLRARPFYLSRSARDVSVRDEWGGGGCPQGASPGRGTRDAGTLALCMSRRSPQHRASRGSLMQWMAVSGATMQQGVETGAVARGRFDVIALRVRLSFV